VAKQTVRLAQETKEMATRTLERLNEQSAQIDRITKESDDTQRIAKDNKKVMKDLKKGWVQRLFCMCFTKNEYPSTTVKWHSDEDRIKSMTKTKKDKYLKEQAKARARTDASLATASPNQELAGIPEEEDFDTAVDRDLDVLGSTVEDLKQIALEMQLQTDVNNVKVTKMGASIDRTREMVKGNDKTMSQLAPALHKKHAADEYSQDRLLLSGAKASIQFKLANL